MKHMTITPIDSTLPNAISNRRNPLTFLRRNSANCLGALALGFCFLGAETAAAQTPITVSGTVLIDADGGNINGTPASTAANLQLYVYLLDNNANNNVVAKAVVAPNGTYSLTAMSFTNYNVSLSTANIAVNTQNPNLGLPASYAPTAEGVGLTGDGFADYGVAINAAGNLVINYAFDTRPVGNSYTITNPEYDNQGRVIVPEEAMTGYDAEDGVYAPGFPGRAIDLYQAGGATLRYDNQPITFTSANTATRISNFDINKLRLDPPANQNPNATMNATFAFSIVDNATVPELVPNSVVFTTPLGITMESFTARRKATSTVLDWVTASETNNARFEIERSEDGLNYQTIGEVVSLAKNGYSTQRLVYAFEDGKALTGNKGIVLYRIKQYDFNGEFSYTETIRLSTAQSGVIKESGLSVYPNPSKGQINVDINNASAGSLMTVTSPTGQIVYMYRYPAAVTGKSNTTVDLSGLSSGTYFIHFGSPSGFTESKKLVVSND